jgi:tetratricopeptide (TPR) repeat protein
MMANGASADADDLGNAIERGDTAWERRAEGHRQAAAAPGPINEAIAAYEEALAQAPTDLEARWKLMRALFFQGEHVVSGREACLRVFERGRQLGEHGISQLSAGAGGRKRFLELSAAELRAAVDEPTLGAEVLFWSAVHTGLWGRTRGKLASAREGVASKIHDYASASIALDDTIENGGGHRILGRLHTEAPRIPFITGWIDRETAVSELEICFAMAPDDLTTRLYLGEALIEFVPKRRQEGLALLRDLIERDPDPRWLMESNKAIADAKAILARIDG